MAGGALEASLRIFRARDAAAIAGELFRECFGADFPVPRDHVIAVPTPPEAWHQYVAVYRWPDGQEEAVGFCNWIRHRDVYLQGGMCVRRNFYRRLPREQYRELERRGGLAQLMMATAEREIGDCVAWFGYCGDPRALAVDLRAGYETTPHRFVIVKWFHKPAAAEAAKLVDEIAAIGPF